MQLVQPQQTRGGVPLTEGLALTHKRCFPSIEDPARVFALLGRVMHARVGADGGVANREEVPLRVEGGAVGHDVAEIQHLKSADDNREHRGA